MPARKRPGAIRADTAVAIASHAAMGVAMGLVFTLILFNVPLFGVLELIDHGIDPDITLKLFICIVVTTFGIGAALTGAVLIMEDS